jgi:glycosyltransferase involved in cell wall biosynthesis
MANILLITESFPDDLSSGAHIRVHNFVRELVKYDDCFLVYLNEDPEELGAPEDLGLVGTCALPAIPRPNKASLGYFRFSDARILRRAYPHYLREAQSTVNSLVRRWKIDLIICLAPITAEIVLELEIPKLLDCCDSRVLAYRRMMANRAVKMSPLERFTKAFVHGRQRLRERSLVRSFDYVTTISAADKRCLVEIAGVKDEVVKVVANGVSEKALNSRIDVDQHRRSVVFWGNLDFPPNWTAVEYFHSSIFLPYLMSKGIEWHIIGSGAGDSVKELARHPSIRFHGYVDDLYEEIGRHGAMVNPMVEGGGMKNKVLEAFACRLPVVSTPIGVDAVGAESGTHCLVANSPYEFSEAVIRLLDDPVLASNITANARKFVEKYHRWDVVGAQLHEIAQIALDRPLLSRSPA